MKKTRNKTDCIKMYRNKKKKNTSSSEDNIIC